MTLVTMLVAFLLAAVADLLGLPLWAILSSGFLCGLVVPPTYRAVPRLMRFLYCERGKHREGRERLRVPYEQGHFVDHTGAGRLVDTELRVVNCRWCAAKIVSVGVVEGFTVPAHSRVSLAVSLPTPERLARIMEQYEVIPD